MIVYQYRPNAASYDGASFVVNHRGRDVIAVDAPDGVWQLLLTEGWLVLPPSVPLRVRQEESMVEPSAMPTSPSHEPATVPVAPVAFPIFTGTPIPADYPNRLQFIRDGIETTEELHAIEDDGA